MDVRYYDRAVGRCGILSFINIVTKQMVSATRQSAKDVEFKLIASSRHKTDACCLHLSACFRKVV